MSKKREFEVGQKVMICKGGERKSTEYGVIVSIPTDDDTRILVKLNEESEWSWYGEKYGKGYYWYFCIHNSQVIESIKQVRIISEETYTKYTKMDIEKVEKLIDRYGIKSWIEGGINVVEIGDALVNKKCTFFNRLRYYDKDNKLQFCEEKDCICGDCGGIELNSGTSIYYNIIINK